MTTAPFRNMRFVLDEMTYFWNTKTHVVFFFVVHFMLLYFSPNECPGLCQHRPGHSLGKKNKVAQNEKSYVGFRISKI